MISASFLHFIVQHQKAYLFLLILTQQCAGILSLDSHTHLIMMQLALLIFLLHFLDSINSLSIPSRGIYTETAKLATSKEKPRNSTLVSVTSKDPEALNVPQLPYRRSQTPHHEGERPSVEAGPPQQASSPAGNSSTADHGQQPKSTPSANQNPARSQTPAVESVITRIFHVVITVLTLFNINITWRLRGKQEG